MVELRMTWLRGVGCLDVARTVDSGHDFRGLLDSDLAKPNVVLLDLRLKNGSGMDVLNELRDFPGIISPVVLSSAYELQYSAQMLQMGAAAFLPKSVSRQALLKVIRRVHEDGHYWSAEQLDFIGGQVSASTPQVHLPSQNSLSEREIEVLKHLCQQLTTQEIANRLHLSPKTVETHRSNLFVKISPGPPPPPPWASFPNWLDSQGKSPVSNQIQPA